MIRITQLEYHTLEENIKQNKHLNITGKLDYTGNYFSENYHNNNVKWLYKEYTNTTIHYYAKKELLRRKLLQQCMNDIRTFWSCVVGSLKC